MSKDSTDTVDSEVIWDIAARLFDAGVELVRRAQRHNLAWDDASEAIQHFGRCLHEYTVLPVAAKDRWLLLHPKSSLETVLHFAFNLLRLLWPDKVGALPTGFARRKLADLSRRWRTVKKQIGTVAVPDVQEINSGLAREMCRVREFPKLPPEIASAAYLGAESAQNVSTDGWLGPKELAEQFGVDYQALRKRLERWRQKNQGKSGRDWIAVTDAGPRGPRYLYRVFAVRPIIEKMSH